MLTRLKVSGFKNLVDVDVRFGPFTCIAGPNGVGKSNLFDAIHFLSALADLPLVDAALSVRSEGGRTADVRSLFNRVGEQSAHRMRFEAEMIIPSEGIDDLGQHAKASITFLRYRLDLRNKETADARSVSGLEIEREELTHIKRGAAPSHLLFPHNARAWRSSAVTGERRVPFFISTTGDGDNRVIQLHQDGGSSGRPSPRQASRLPRTVLSATNAAESPTALLARREMQSWRLLQLEPSALRQPDEFTASSRLATDGSHLAATLYRLEQESTATAQDSTVDDGSPDAYSQVARRLQELVDDVREVRVDRDERRELLTVEVRQADGTICPARALSDGTLRFLALSVIELDPHFQGVLCLEEPENGIHPARIPAMLKLLGDISADVEEKIGADNPLRQVIVNTHSPAVVSEVPDDSLLMAELHEAMQDGERVRVLSFGCLPDTWRLNAGGQSDIPREVSRGTLIDYLNPMKSPVELTPGNGVHARRSRRIPRRVADRQDLQMLLPNLQSR